MDSIWGDDPGIATDNNWFEMKTVFTTAGYRDGVIAGKERALQEGFDDGFASVASPIGRELGILRGIASALLPFVISHSSHGPDQDSLTNEVRLITSLLADIRFADITPRDVDAEEHARQHSNRVDGQSVVNEGVDAETRMDRPQPIVGTSSAETQSDRPTMDNVRQLKKRLEDLTHRLGLTISLS